ncbi:MAG: hypothetical protein DMG49_24735 [Acidobacteria bacterium]|nr:MAG: hypothetical protein DMG49_24735 [Acidobacteriota bacterium]
MKRRWLALALKRLSMTVGIRSRGGKCLSVSGLNQTLQGRNQFGADSVFCDVPFGSHQTGT